eukprot:CAMPEP_0197666072 /NCGR_PEP_ID=MMETSP1338-20131121/61446_1 /TAXON_ID=43686 ORGANISM="Pelagodinium beii, Strain RCC1491" /NCGR_SAMPLE_ID=MMETSP1338 /ASSEMBLY_ACC=CAM_ASM_000754 /LENGTH=462 /DNA_ID=CAMNT_0043245043 /DNA_START=21 /DNA_END=1409 /DNA_ORIENTATION=-
MAGTVDSGDTAFMFISMALVQFMTPGLAFFYGGLVRSTNVIAIMLQNYISLGLVFALWYVVLFSLSFGESLGGVIGNPFTFGFFENVAVRGPLELHGNVLIPDIPGILYAAYQGMFAVITPALMTGAFADRFRVGPYLLFVTLWMFLIYGPVCHWVWGGGWMQKWGVWDFAGGIVVHATSGFSALASLLVLGSRYTPKHLADDEIEVRQQPHNVPFTALGTAILWFGWFGFNGGSALASNGTAVVAALNSQIAGSVAMVGWLSIDYFMGKKPGLVSACVGAVAGLATVTPAAGFIQPWAAFLLGGIASCVCYSCVELLSRSGFDDALDVWGVHGMGGFTGTALLGLLADSPLCGSVATAEPWCVNPGTVTRSASQFFLQLACVSIVSVYSFCVAFIILKLQDSFCQVRPRKSEEENLDATHIGESAYVTHKSDQQLLSSDGSEDDSEVEKSDGLSARQLVRP